MNNSDHQVTYTLLMAEAYAKDNRLLPLGFNKDLASADIAVVGDVLADGNFIGGSVSNGQRSDLAHLIEWEGKAS